MAFAAVLASAAVGLGGILSLSAVGDGSPSEGAKRIYDAAVILANRSPGERTVATLDTKRSPPRVARLARRQPRSDVLGRRAPPDEGVDIVELAPLAATFDVIPMLPVTFMDNLPGLAETHAAGPLITGGPTGNPFVGGFVPPGETDTPPVVVNPPPVSAVPEASTWLMLLTGFGLMGARLRSVRRRTASIVSRSALGQQGR